MTTPSSTGGLQGELRACGREGIYLYSRSGPQCNLLQVLGFPGARQRRWAFEGWSFAERTWKKSPKRSRVWFKLVKRMSYRL